MTEQILWVNKNGASRSVVTSDHEITIRMSKGKNHKNMLLIYFDRDFVTSYFAGAEYVRVGFSIDHKYFYFKPATKALGHKLSNNSDTSLVCKISLNNANEEVIAEHIVGVLDFEGISKNLYRANSTGIEWR